MFQNEKSLLQEISLPLFSHAVSNFKQGRQMNWTTLNVAGNKRNVQSPSVCSLHIFHRHQTQQDAASLNNTQQYSTICRCLSTRLLYSIKLFVVLQDVYLVQPRKSSWVLRCPLWHHSDIMTVSKLSRD